VAVDTFFVGALKGIGKVYLQTVLPFFEAHEARGYTILSDNGREFCGRPDHHLYELFLQLEGIEHRTTKVRRPQSNGFIERPHQGRMMEGQTPYNMFKKGLKLIPQEVRTKVA